MQELIALLGTTDWPQGGVTAEAELANAVASISGPLAAEPKTTGLQTPGQEETSEVPETPTAAAALSKKSVDAEIAMEPEKELRSLDPAQDRAELMHGLTAEIAAAAQKAAQDAISSSLQVGLMVVSVRGQSYMIVPYTASRSGIAVSVMCLSQV